MSLVNEVSGSSLESEIGRLLHTTLTAEDRRVILRQLDDASTTLGDQVMADVPLATTYRFILEHVNVVGLLARAGENLLRSDEASVDDLLLIMERVHDLRLPVAKRLLALDLGSDQLIRLAAIGGGYTTIRVAAWRKFLALQPAPEQLVEMINCVPLLAKPAWKQLLGQASRLTVIELGRLAAGMSVPAYRAVLNGIIAGRAR